MASGIKCHPSCVVAFNDLKMNKRHRYILFHIHEKEEIRILRQADRDATYSDFLNDLIEAMKSGEGRYAVYDYEYPNKGTALFFIVWTPTSSNIKTKMIYAASRDAIKSQLQGIKHCLEAHDLDDICEEQLSRKGQPVQSC
ncbi:unnamed protein product [Trichobilharzia szidati]|nr:unnamed protein product [Trichobilharzia szidati]